MVANLGKGLTDMLIGKLFVEILAYKVERSMLPHKQDDMVHGLSVPV